MFHLGSEAVIFPVIQVLIRVVIPDTILVRVTRVVRDSRRLTGILVEPDSTPFSYVPCDLLMLRVVLRSDKDVAVVRDASSCCPSNPTEVLLRTVAT